jgi:2-amino-4-hydroxy-6-hydroxymethyldihydropteridine diphosphokinase
VNETAHTAFIALGSNLGDRRATLCDALESLSSDPAITVVVCSSFIETRAVTKGDATHADPQPDYLNAAAQLETTLLPRELLDVMLRLEQEFGRVRAASNQWASRTLDLDLLFYDDLTIDEPGLIVPHPRLHRRQFVLKPMTEIAPDYVHPIKQRTVLELLDRLAAEMVSSPLDH